MVTIQQKKQKNKTKQKNPNEKQTSDNKIIIVVYHVQN